MFGLARKILELPNALVLEHQLTSLRSMADKLDHHSPGHRASLEQVIELLVPVDRRAHHVEAMYLVPIPEEEDPY